jgi:MoxR-like ATPase
MIPPSDFRTLKGSGDLHHSWWRGEDDEVKPPVASEAGRWPDYPLGHPAAYETGPDLVDAVNVALMLRKPLLVTGNPGTGKTELAERIAYEFNLGAVLRFEAQSLSEANDLFYRFDYIAQLVVAKLVESDRARPEDADVLNFVHWGPLGTAIRRSAPNVELALRDLARLRSSAKGQRPLPLSSTAPGRSLSSRDSPAPAVAPPPPSQSVVLIDEIDKASRDFPNDLLNGIDRMEFKLRELGGFALKGAGRDSPFHPIVIVTSNSERDLPAPFMRRCVFAHIADPGQMQLAAIVRKRVFNDYSAPPDGTDGLPPLYSRLLGTFVELRDGGDLKHPVGTSELIDFFTAALLKGVDGRLTDGRLVDRKITDPTVLQRLVTSLGALAKHSGDRQSIADVLTGPIGSLAQS